MHQGLIWVKRRNTRKEQMISGTLRTDITKHERYVGKVPQAEVQRHAITCTTLNDTVQSVLDEVSDYRHGAFRCIGVAGNKETVRTERAADAVPPRCRVSSLARIPDRFS